jgi:hemerythrin
MTIQWDESLRLGVPATDSQHEEIFAYFDKLTDALQTGDARKEVAELLAFLADYADTHFEDEEGLMVSVKYPGLNAQLMQHAQFKENIKTLAGLLSAGVPLQEIAIKADAILIRYFILHVRKLDRDLVDHVKSQPL